MPLQQKQQDVKWPIFPTLLLAAGLFVAAGSVVLTFGTESRWIGHTVTGTVGLILMAVVIVTGAVRKGRIRNARLHHVFRYHTAAGIWFSLFIIGTFILGLLTTLEHGEPLLESPHGVVGLVLVVLALAQVVTSLAVRSRVKIQLFHRIIGYATIPLYILQVVLGIYAAATG